MSDADRSAFAAIADEVGLGVLVAAAIDNLFVAAYSQSSSQSASRSNPFSSLLSAPQDDCSWIKIAGVRGGRRVGDARAGVFG